jgi:hypothetical protein
MREGEFVEGLEDPNAPKEFMGKGIWVEEPHLYFVWGMWIGYEPMHEIYRVYSYHP